MMKRTAKGDLIRGILEFSLSAEAPRRLTKQVEWHEFVPIGFLLIQSLRPRHILEVGTTIGDSYLAFCQAVETCGLSSECLCAPCLEIASFPQREALQLEEFRTYHDAHYAKFSAIEGLTASRQRMHKSPQLFDLIHLIGAESAAELAALCSTWLTQLNPSGVALISGKGKLDQSQFSRIMPEISRGFCTRVMQMRHWIAILSKRPVGIVRDLLLSPPNEFNLAVELLRLLGDRVSLEHSLLAQKKDTEQLSSEAEHLRHTSDSLMSEIEALTVRLATTEDSEIEAQIRFGRTDLRLDQMWAEKEELRRRLEESQDSSRPSTADDSKEDESPASGNSVLFEDTKRELLRLCRRYASECPSPSSTGRDFWDDCGRRILTTILKEQRGFAFPKSSQPTVSVIVVLRNKAHLSILCLCSLLLEMATDCELIVVDNGSTDETSGVLSLLDSVTVIRNSDNPGFGPAAMQGASRATGEFLCFLNNDALVGHGTLATSLRAFSDRPDTGAVGGKILLADGRLQEAGCIVWRDGRPQQYGRGGDPRLPQYNFRRPVDYCSGAYLVTPRQLFHELRGFDNIYAPAYFEDTDYCMKLWSAKRPVIYEPRSLVHHYEAASSSSSAATREAIVVNHRRFTDRWRNTLRAYPIERPDNIVRSRIAAQSGSPRCLYFWGGFPASPGKRYTDPRLRQVRSLIRDRNVVTCLCAGEDNYSEARSFFPIDVELRGLKSLSTTELSNYCKASELIVVATREAFDLPVSSVLGDHSAKITRVEG